MRLLAAFDSGDHLHPSDAGYRPMANAIPPSLFGSSTDDWPAGSGRSRRLAAPSQRAGPPPRHHTNPEPGISAQRHELGCPNRWAGLRSWCGWAGRSPRPAWSAPSWRSYS